MLTKNLVRYKIADHRISPQFVKPGDEKLLAFAESLRQVFKSSLGKTRSQLLEEAKLLVDSAPFSAITARGLEKLLLDRTEFDTAPNEALMELRQNVFAKSSKILSTQSFADPERYRAVITDAFKSSSDSLSAHLYSDLPENQTVTHFKTISAERLLHRYNCAQVQGLLIHCEKVKVELWDSSPEQLRQLFKYLRFFQLLADIRKDESDHFHITVDGPLSLFYQTQKYGLNLALFFPAVLHQQNWRLEAQIKFKGRKKTQLHLDNSCGIEPYSHQFLAYVPEEIRLFQESFRQRADAWDISPANSFVPLEGELYCFPDYMLKHESGREVAMELFHPWHASHFTSRLQHLDHLNKPPLVLGISNALLKDPLVADGIENSSYFAMYGFTFRKMPTVDKVKKVLKKIVEASG